MLNQGLKDGILTDKNFGLHATGVQVWHSQLKEAVITFWCGSLSGKELAELFYRHSLQYQSGSYRAHLYDISVHLDLFGQHGQNESWWYQLAALLVFTRGALLGEFAVQEGRQWLESIGISNPDRRAILPEGVPVPGCRAYFEEYDLLKN